MGKQARRAKTYTEATRALDGLEHVRTHAIVERRQLGLSAMHQSKREGILLIDELLTTHLR